MEGVVVGMLDEEHESAGAVWILTWAMALAHALARALARALSQPRRTGEVTHRGSAIARSRLQRRAAKCARRVVMPMAHEVGWLEVGAMIDAVRCGYLAHGGTPPDRRRRAEAQRRLAVRGPRH